MRIGVPRERAPLERRVALTPKSVAALVDQGLEVVVESGAGARAGFPDVAYLTAGAAVDRDSTADAQIVALVGPPEVSQVESFGEGTVVVGFLAPFTHRDLVAAYQRRRVVALAFEALPRTTLAQGMDALSSQATAAGYGAALLAAGRCPKFFPMLTTAAGTVPPAKVLVIGAGVAGLQAIATCRRLGAVVSAYDVRPEVREQVESVGARFVAAPVEAEVATVEGYARELGDDAQRRQREALAPHVEGSDVVITTAAVPGHAAPLLIDTHTVERMAPGSVVIDLAVVAGGNCELSRADEEVDHEGVWILGPTDLPSSIARDASEMYARNVTAFLGLVVKDEAIEIDLQNPITAGACVVQGEEIRHPASRKLVEREGRS